MLKEFWDFINRGNVMDLAVAVVIGAAFSTIVNSLVEDIVTPALLNPAMQAAGVDQMANLTRWGIAYGSFFGGRAQLYRRRLRALSACARRQRSAQTPDSR